MVAPRQGESAEKFQEFASGCRARPSPFLWRILAHPVPRNCSSRASSVLPVRAGAGVAEAAVSAISYASRNPLMRLAQVKFPAILMGWTAPAPGIDVPQRGRL